MKRNNLNCLLVILFMATTDLSAQVIASFASRDTVCVGAELEIENTTMGGGTTFFWNFCGLDLGGLPEGENLGNLSQLNLPTFTTLVEENGEYFGFVTNYTNHKLIRLDFGTSLSNTPVATDVGAFQGIVHTALQGISIHKDNGSWWGYAVTGYSTNPSLIRYSFGTSIKNIPEAETLGNVGGMNFPHELLIFEENGEWFGWTVNLFGQDLVRFSFGENLGDDPVGLNIGNVGGLNGCTGFTTFQQEGQWHMFVTNSNSLTRLDFGDLLSNIPTGVNLGEDPNFDKIRDIIITNKCGILVGLVLNGGSDNIAVLDFQGDIYNNPISIPGPQMEGLDVPHSFSNIIREENNEIFLVPSAGNDNLFRFQLASCNAATPLFSNSETPPSVIYDSPGEYVIELVVDEGLPTESHFCKSVLVVEAILDLGQDTVICEGESIELFSNISNTTWPDGSKGNYFIATQTDLYIAQADTLVCQLYDTISVSVINCQRCLFFPNAFTPDGDGQNDAFSALNACPFDLTTYEMKIFNRWGEEVFLSSHISNKWNGNFKGEPAPTDIYIWQLNFAYPDTATGRLLTFRESGELTLIR